MLDYFHPKVHLMIGGTVFVGSLIVASYMVNFYLFLMFYSICVGIGYGLIYMLPLKNAWQFFPEHKGMVGGIILASHSFAAIGWSFYTTGLVNPHNEIPNYYLNLGNSIELLFGPESSPVTNVKHMLTMVSYIQILLFFSALALINKKA